MDLDKFPKNVKIIEVGPRDGLQNEKVIISSLDKIKLINLLSESGLTNIEITSFVKKEKIPQLFDASLVYESVQHLPIDMPVLIPNLKGLENALKVNVKNIALFTATSNTFNKKNINASTKESLLKLEKVFKEIKNKDIKVRGYISTSFGCPYEGDVNISVLVELVEWFIDKGVYEISLGDTIGVANPKLVTNILTILKEKVDLDKIALHFHDTNNLAIANILTSLEFGIDKFDSSIGGLGGCPYAVGSSGNIATEKVLYLMNSMDIDTGLDFKKLNIAAKFINSIVKG